MVDITQKKSSKFSFHLEYIKRGENESIENGLETEENLIFIRFWENFLSSLLPENHRRKEKAVEHNNN